MACDFQFYFQVIFLKVTADTHTYKQRLLGATVVCAMCIKQLELFH